MHWLTEKNVADAKASLVEPVTTSASFSTSKTQRHCPRGQGRFRSKTENYKVEIPTRETAVTYSRKTKEELDRWFVDTRAEKVPFSLRPAVVFSLPSTHFEHFELSNYFFTVCTSNRNFLDRY